MKDRESTNPAMDAEAEKAKKELIKLFKDSPGAEPESLDVATYGHGILVGQLDVVSWWNKWYLKAGHKRLGRILKDQETVLKALIAENTPVKEAKAS